MPDRTKTVKGKITRIGVDNKFEVGGIHTFTSPLISDYHKDQLIEITYDPDTGVVKEMKSMEGKKIE